MEEEKEVEAKVALRKAGAHAFAHRRDKKNDMRKLLNVRMNAALRELGNYIQQIHQRFKEKGYQTRQKDNGRPSRKSSNYF